MLLREMVSGCAVTASGTEHFWIGDDVAECPEDEFYSWFMDELGGRRSAGSVPELGEGPATVRMVQGEVYQVETKGDEFIVLDSGADVSLVPWRYPLAKLDVMLQDAQGAQVNVSGMRRIELALLGAESEVQCNIGESFVVAGVTNILVSLGRLMKMGWTAQQSEIPGEAGKLVTPDGSVDIPVYFRRKVVRANVMSVQELSKAVVRSVQVDVGFSTISMEPKRGRWNFLDNGTPCMFSSGNAFLLPPGDGRTNMWKYRTTAVRREGGWCAIEIGADLSSMVNREERVTCLPLCIGVREVKMNFLKKR